MKKLRNTRTWYNRHLYWLLNSLSSGLRVSTRKKKTLTKWRFRAAETKEIAKNNDSKTRDNDTQDETIINVDQLVQEIRASNNAKNVSPYQHAKIYENMKI